MMQRKNKSRSSAAAHGRGSSSSSGYDSSNSSAGVVNDGVHHGGSTSSVLPLPTSTTTTAAAAAASIPSSASSPSITDDDLLGNGNNNNNNNSNKNISNVNNIISEKVKVATVKRHTCGTRPFDYYWLNLDCCGLICASLTYILHLYAIYSFGWILLPPWFSIMDEDGYRYLTFGCYLHRLLFIGIAILAIFSHFKAMTTDPGAVPPDAHPLSEKEDERKLQMRGDWEYEELDSLIKGEVLHHSSSHHPTNQSSSLQQQQQQLHLHPQTSKAVNVLNNNLVEEGMTRDGAGNSSSNGAVANRRTDQLSTSSSSLMQEVPEPLDDTNGTKWNNIGLPQAATATATAAVVAAAAMTTGVAAMASVGADVVVGAGTGRGRNNGDAVLERGSWEERSTSHGIENFVHSPSSLHLHHQHQQVQQRGRRMCRRCHAFKPPRAHHCR
jgi:hypothetical protein